MNALIVGSNKRKILHDLPDRFLFIDDGSLASDLQIPKRRAVTFFDVATHSFNPLKDMDYRRAREFLGVLDAVFPEGQGTLTARRSRFQILEALLSKPHSLARLISDTKDTEDAYQKIQMLLMSPVLKNVLTTPTGPSTLNFNRTIVAKLDRAALGDFDCFVLGNLLISQYPGAVVIPDFGFYASPFHVGLIRQNRLIAGINSFDEVPDLKTNLLLIDDKTGSRCTFDDAHTLALYRGLQPGNGHYSTFIHSCITGEAA